MPILSDRELREMVQDKNAIESVEGPDFNADKQIGPSSVDLRLGYEFGFIDEKEVDILDTKDMDPVRSKKTVSAEQGIIIHPGQFMLSTTLEELDVPDDVVVRVEGRSSYARIGLIPHAAGGFVDAGFKGQVTLELQNLGNVPIRIYPEKRICQVAFERMTSPAENPYGDRSTSKYMGQRGATHSRLSEES
jgi:dCTP deaminase